MGSNRENRYLAVIAQEDEIEHKWFHCRGAATDFVMERLERVLPENLQDDSWDVEDAKSAASAYGMENEEAEQFLDVYYGKRKLDYCSDDLYISPGKVLYRTPVEDPDQRIFCAEIIDVKEAG